MLEVHLLGKFEVRVDGRLVEIQLRAAQALLAYLLLNAGTEQRREQVAGLLWPDMTDAKAKDNLRHTLWVIRKALGSRDYLLTDDLSVSFNTTLDYWLDSALLERRMTGDTSADDLIAIVSAYGGGLLPGFYDDWIVLERERLQAAFERKMALLLDKLVEAQRWPEVLDWGERWIALGHVPEPAYRALMSAHAGLGDMASVATVYQRCVEALQEELSVEPAAQTRALYEHLQREAKKRGTDLAAEIPIPRHNLPAPLTSFIGREADVAQVRDYLHSADKRLVTLVGPPGIGKTRLSLQVAADLIDDFEHGVWFIELAPLTDPALIPQTVAFELGLREEQGRPLLATLSDFLHAKVVLIILDNCEHLLDECAQFALSILQAAPKLKILASSRETLGVGGEVTYRLPSLSAPDPQDLPPLETLAQFDAVKLFLDRATAAQPAFQMNSTNAPALSQICHRLDGIPLAIELAAARVRGMKIEEIAQRLDDRFRLLTGGSRTALPRQQTLRATIDWSHGLLSEQERILFRRLPVFAGGWTIEAAETVCAGDELESLEVLDLLLHLIDKSLILIDEHSDETRYYMLQTIREYAREKLLDSGEGESRRQHHLEYFIGLARQAGLKLRGPEQKTWVKLLKADTDNIRAALEWSLDSGQVVKGLDLVGELDRFWAFHNTHEDHRWLEVALQHPAGQGRTPIRAKALYVAALTGNSEGRYATARAYAEESVAIWRELGDKHGLAYALGELGLQRGMLGDFPAARSLDGESITLFRETDDRWGLALSLRYLGNWPSEDGDYAVARASLLESLALFREIGDQQATGMPLYGLGTVAARQGNYSAAQRWFEETLALRREAGEMWGVAFVSQALGWVARIENDYQRAATHLSECLAISLQLSNIRLMSDALYEMAMIATRQGQMQRAARLFGATAGLLKIVGLEIEAYYADEYGKTIGAVRAELDETTFNAAWEEGEEMTMEEAVEYAVGA